MGLTVNDMIYLAEKAGEPRLAYLLGKYPSVLQKYLGVLEPKLGPVVSRLRAAEAGSVAVPSVSLTAEEQAVVPLLHQLQAALDAGGGEGAMAAFRQQVSDPAIRALYRALAA